MPGYLGIAAACYLAAGFALAAAAVAVAFAVAVGVVYFGVALPELSKEKWSLRICMPRTSPECRPKQL